MSLQKVETKIGSKMFSMETGRMANLAHGAVLVSCGESVVLTAAVMGPSRVSENGGDDFLPLTVDYREKTCAAGKIPGGFFKREGRPSTKEILTMRMTDRPLRPLFPEGFTNEIQIMSLVLSAEKESDPDILAINGASAALVISGIPFNGPIGAVRVGRIAEEFVVNPSLPELEQSSLELIVAGTEESIIMVEGGAREVSEEILLEAISFGHQQIKQIILIQKELREKVQPVPRPVELKTLDRSLLEKIRPRVYRTLKEKFLITSKQERREAIKEIQNQIIGQCLEESAGCDKNARPDNIGDGRSPAEKQTELAGSIKKVFSQLEKEVARELILEGKRMDGRKATDIRPITCEVGILPRTHGSALFTRGETQALVLTTLGTSRDEQIIDGLMEEYSKKFILHYNFPPFSVGETKPVRGPGRREIGHGNLAERALESMLPKDDEFPYTIRVVSDILQSNGSSSMATICGGTLSLMDAGVPIKSPVAGIAMGLIKKDNQVAILSDILGGEDKYGDMDFKVAGTAKGITALQMDIKTSGLTIEIMQQALAQAKTGRLFILEKMAQVISAPRTEIAPHAPRIVKLKINPDKIGLIIGPGGKNIRKIEAETGVTIEIEDDGTVNLFATDQASLEQAKSIIETLTARIETGKVYQGKVVSVKDFGAFVELPNKDEGLVHISELADGFVKNVEDVVSRGDPVTVRVLSVDSDGKIRLTMKQSTITAEDLPKLDNARQSSSRPGSRYT
ncbi:MAG: polyribonucleotide nucleotidyltransferase [Planctomycetota bacterium]